MILKELHLTDALGRISIFPPLTHNGEVRILTWPQVIDISKIRDIQIVGTSGLIKFWKLEKILLRTVAVARAYTFLEVRSRDSTWSLLASRYSFPLFFSHPSSWSTAAQVPLGAVTNITMIREAKSRIFCNQSLCRCAVSPDEQAVL